MDFVSLPIIVVCCYLIGELYKLIFKNKRQAYKIIPVFLAIVGGILGVVIYFANPEIMLNAENVWVALLIGIVSGSSSTGTNQIVKQLFSKQNEVKKDDPSTSAEIQSKD